MNTGSTELRFSRLLQTSFQQQAAEVGRLLSSDILHGDSMPDLEHWPGQLAVAIKPLVTQIYQQGVTQSRMRLFGMRTGRPMRLPQRIVVPNGHAFGEKLKSVGISFDLFDPRVLRAVDRATMEFCEETNATAVGNLKDTIRKLRELLKHGLEEGKAVALLAREVKRIFADPARAYRIAATESARAVNAGALLNAKESGLKLKKEWISSGGSCRRCQNLDGVQKGLDEPFVIDGTGPYARVMHPPLHPHCICTWTEVMA